MILSRMDLCLFLYQRVGKNSAACYGQRKLFSWTRCCNVFLHVAIVQKVTTMRFAFQCCGSVRFRDFRDPKECNVCISLPFPWPSALSCPPVRWPGNYPKQSIFEGKREEGLLIVIPDPQVETGTPQEPWPPYP